MHRNRAKRARYGITIGAALWLGCASNDDIVATAVEVEVDAPSSSAGSLIGGAAAPPPGVAGGGTQVVIGPISGAMMAGRSVPLAPPPPFVLSIRALLVSGTPRLIPSGDAEPWPFPELLRDVFGVPTPNAPVEPVIEVDPFRVEQLRRLGDAYGFEPGVAAAMLVVVDVIDDQYDITISEPE